MELFNEPPSVRLAFISDMPVLVINCDHEWFRDIDITILELALSEQESTPEDQ